MNNLVRFFNQNRKTIIIVTIVVISILIMLNMANDYLKQKNIENDKQYYNELQQQIKNLNTGVKNQDFDLSGSKKSSEKLKSDKQVIDEFVKYCNEGNIEDAYNMLTDECKENLYPEENSFEKNYYNKIFNKEDVQVTVESWNDSTYLVKFQEDILATGKTSKNGDITDYITIKVVDGNKKLNISGFIKRATINEQRHYDDLYLKVNYKDVYMDYEIYNFTFKNSTSGKVLIDDLKNINSIYIEDKAGAKYSAYNNELTTAELLLNEKSKRTISVKFSNIYRANKTISKIVFSNVIYDYGEENSNKEIEVEFK